VSSGGLNRRLRDGEHGKSEPAADVPFVGLPVTVPHVVDVLRTTQSTGVAPEKWLGQVLSVLTESGSRYVIDTVHWTLQRTRGRNEQDDPEVAPASTLRRDGETLKLLRVLILEVGQRAIFDVEALRSDAMWTRRTTTFVIAVSPRP
jgi:hypothetical protein